jgi:hypothetical protein
MTYRDKHKQRKWHDFSQGKRMVLFMGEAFKIKANHFIFGFKMAELPLLMTEETHQIFIVQLIIQ